MTILDAVHDANLFRPLFKKLDTWEPWFVVLKALFALPMDDADRAMFTQVTGRDVPPVQQVQEAWLVIGRRGGKSRIVALVAVFLACFRDYRSFLAPGERGTIMVIATDRKQARTIMRYVAAFLAHVPMLAAMIERQDTECVDLNNSVTIEITTCSYRSVRGYTVVAALCDEIAFWRDENSANPAQEILDALRPAMATIPGAILIGLSSPYRRSGPLYENWKRHYGRDGSPVLIVQAPTRLMNPGVPQSVIDRAMEFDAAAAQAEYFATFRHDVGSFLDSDLIEQAIETGRRERPPLVSLKYRAFVDPSGGAHDAFTLAIAHKEAHRVILDVLRGVKPPFNPSSVVANFAALLKSYRAYTVQGDRYAGAWVVEEFHKHGVRYQHTAHSKSHLYLESLPLFARGAVSLLDDPVLTRELKQLERRTSRSGKDSVDHPPSGHDDHANAVCGCLAIVAESSRGTTHIWLPEFTEPGATVSEQRQLITSLGLPMFAPPSTEVNCGTCQAFDAASTRCTLRTFHTQAHYPSCDAYLPRRTEPVEEQASHAS